MKKLLSDQREQVRVRFIHGCKDRQATISVLRSNITHNNRVDRDAYSQQYDHEMRTISTYETELKSILATKAKYQKDTDEQKLDMSKAAVTMERQTNAA